MKLFLESGFTLLEMLITATVASVAGFLLIQIFVSNSGLYYQQTAKIAQGVSINDAVSEISSDVKSASSVAAVYPLSSPIATSSATSLVLEIPSVDSSGNVIDKTYDFTVLARDATNSQILREKVYPDPTSQRKLTDKVLVNNLSQVTFIYLDDSNNVVAPSSATKVNFTLNLSVKAGLSNQQSSASAKVNLRNV